MLINQTNTIRENSKIFRKKKCTQHKMSYLQKVCTHPNCLESTTLSLLCDQCCRKHPKIHNGLIQNYLEFEKVFSQNVFEDIELLENECLNLFLEQKQRMDDEVDRQCDIILEEVKQSLKLINIRIKLKYGSNNLLDSIIKLKESLKIEYNALFSINEVDINDKDIKQYVEFYINFEKMLDENQSKSEEMFEGLEKEFDRISELFNQKLKNIRSVLESDIIK